jgi:hypothetical protein
MAYAIFFFFNDGDPREPPHVHVRGGGRDAKIWLEPEISVAELRLQIRGDCPYPIHGTREQDADPEGMA